MNERLEKSRSGTYADTSENRRKHRVGQKYGSEKKEEEKPEKTDPNKMSPEQQLEAINKVIAAVNEGKLKLPPEEINILVAKKTMAEEAVKQAKGEKKPEKKEEPKKEATKPEAKSEGKQYASMDIKEAKKELVGKKITFKEYFFDGIDSYKDAEGEIKKVRLYGKEKQPIAEIDFPNGDGITISLEQLDKRKAMQYEIEFNDSKSEEPKQEASGQASEADKEDLREARKKLAYLQDNEERLIKRDGKERYEERLKQAKDEVAELKGEKPKEEKNSEAKPEEKEEVDEDGELVTITHDKEKFERYRIFRDLHAARMKRGTSPNLSKMGYLKNSGDVNQKGNEKYYELQKEFGDKKYAFKEETQEQESKGEKKTDKASDPIYQVQQKKKEASKKYDSKREEARQKYDKEADEIRSEIDKLYESDHPDAAKKRKELWNTLKEKTNKYDAETSRLKDEYEAEYKKLDEAEDKLYDQRQKEETSEEVKESYTRVKFEDVPNSGKVNLKKYLSEKVRKGVDEKWSNIKNIPTDNLKKMEKGLVNDLNKNFEAIKKSQRAELLYSIMKVKGELEKRGKESQKKE
ncbi:hypothetical protein [Segatella sp.]|uniref:hypothetical protein n=1 Tax=Segatella sp. TaxID=2974253 RepID=UPI003AB84A9F